LPRATSGLGDAVAATSASWSVAMDKHLVGLARRAAGDYTPNRPVRAYPLVNEYTGRPARAVPGICWNSRLDMPAARQC